MSRKKKRETPEWQWEQALIDAYYDYRYHQVLDPLHDQFLRWKAGELSHLEIDQAIHRTHKQNQELYGLFTENRAYLVGLIQFDHKWFGEWVKDHPPPEGIELVPQALKSSADIEETKDE
jgi:hypothetical protein